MANIKIEFFSSSFNRPVSFNMFIPNVIRLNASEKNEYLESKGQHDMVFWNEYIAKIIKWMFE